MYDSMLRAVHRRGGEGSVIAVSAIPFRPEFRDACAANLCGRYEKNWMCPPDVGPIELLIGRAQSYSHAFVFQTVGALDDSFDFEGMQAASAQHDVVVRALVAELTPALDKWLVLSAGACKFCPCCAREENKPCYHPDQAIASLESYGIAVSELAEASGLKYINGTNTVTYFGAILFNGGKDSRDSR